MASARSSPPKVICATCGVIRVTLVTWMTETGNGCSTAFSIKGRADWESAVGDPPLERRLPRQARRCRAMSESPWATRSAGAAEHYPATVLAALGVSR
jgi:hypothetical protein